MKTPQDSRNRSIADLMGRLNSPATANLTVPSPHTLGGNTASPEAPTSSFVHREGSRADSGSQKDNDTLSLDTLS